MVSYLYIINNKNPINKVFNHSKAENYFKKKKLIYIFSNKIIKNTVA